MVDERKFSSQPATATVGLTDGRTFVGRLGRYSPADPDLVLLVRSRDGRGSAREVQERLAAENIAYVAVHRGDAPVPALPDGAVTLDVHVAGGLTFTVRADGAQIADRLGFWASPLSASGAFAEIWFYAHGINAKEEKVALGDILLETGALAGDGLARGLEEQAAERAANIGEILIEQKRVGAEQVAAAAANQKETGAKGRKLRLGEVLVEAGLAREEDITAALEEQKKRRGKRIG